MIGSILGNRYELLEKIGEGGMAIVYKAKCNILNRYVAIKILKPEYSNNADFMDKFKREALATASFSHNNIVGIYDVGYENNINYIVMEYVKGKTLKEYIKENAPLNTNTTLKISIQIAKALECAHKNGIIHRDIKPHNILITEDDVIKVTDFGIAKATSADTITHTNKVIGSAHYFSPEQAKGKIVDNRTDIYSFGIVMYEMVTGKVPFDGDSAVAVALKHIQDPLIAPKTIVPSIPEGLNNLILKATQKEPIKRYNNITAMLVDLIRIQNDPLYVVRPSELENEYTTVMDNTQLQDTLYASKKLTTNFEDDDDEEDEDSFYEKKGKKPSNSKKAMILIGAGVLLAILLGSITGLFVFNRGNKEKENSEVKVPAIMDMTEENGRKEVEKLELVFTVLGKENSEKPEGTIIAVFPDEGTSVKKKSEVRVKLSAGMEEKIVPDVTNLGKTVAQNHIVNNKLKVGEIVEEFSDDIEAGAVIRTEPKAGTPVKEGDTIKIIVSKGSEVKVEKIPNLKNMTLAEAKNVLETSSFKLGSSTAVITTDKSLDGKIFNQSIEPGTKVQVGTEVNVNYYQYKDPDEGKIAVPKFVGMTQDEAKAEAAKLGLKVIINGDKDGKIISQDIPEGKKVNPGETINLSAQTPPPINNDGEE